jgi:hypothetical protein
VRLLEFRVMKEGSNPETDSITRITLPISPGSGSIIAGKL